MTSRVAKRAITPSLMTVLPSSHRPRTEKRRLSPLIGLSLENCGVMPLAEAWSPTWATEAMVPITAMMPAKGRMMRRAFSRPLPRTPSAPGMVGWAMTLAAMAWTARILDSAYPKAFGSTMVRTSRDSQPPISGERATWPFLRASFFFFGVGFSVLEWRSPAGMVPYPPAPACAPLCAPASRTAPSCTPAFTRLFTYPGRTVMLAPIRRKLSMIWKGKPSQ